MDLLDTIKSAQLPVITYWFNDLQTYNRMGFEDACWLNEDGIYIKLDKIIDIDCVHVKTLPTTTITPESASYDGASVSKEYFLPVDLPFQATVIPRPGTRQRYASVEQILDDNPHYLVAGTDILSSSTIEKEGTLIKTGTKLEVTKLVKTPYVNTDYFECRDTESGLNHLFYNDTPINFNSVSDPRVYTLSELTTSISAPTVIKLIDNKYENQSTTSTDGLLIDIKRFWADVPLEIYGRKTLSCLIGSLDSETDQSCDGGIEAVLIPETVFKLENIAIEPFVSDDDKQRFIEKRFKKGNPFDTFKDGLCIFSLEQCGPVFLEGNRRGKQKVSDEPEYIEFMATKHHIRPKPPPRPKKEEELHEPVYHYYEPIDKKPPLPKPKPVANQDILKRTKETIKERTKLGFDKLHKELLEQFNKSKRFFLKSRSQSETDSHKGDLKSTAPRGKLSRCFSDSSVETSASRYRGRPLPTLPRITSPESHAISSDKIVERVTRLNQTKDDFMTYSVHEVYECLNMCGLGDAADQCLKEKVDGVFVVKLHLSDWKKPPFCLSDFQVRKVEQILNGWRPKLDRL